MDLHSSHMTDTDTHTSIAHDQNPGAYEVHIWKNLDMDGKKNTHKFTHTAHNSLLL